MSEVTFDAANFSEQLGIYVFFNVWRNICEIIC